MIGNIEEIARELGPEPEGVEIVVAVGFTIEAGVFWTVRAQDAGVSLYLADPDSERMEFRARTADDALTAAGLLYRALWTRTPPRVVVELD